MPPKRLLVSALGAIVLSSSTALLAAGATGSDKPSAQTAKELSGSGDATRRSGGSTPGELTDDATVAIPEARLSDKPQEAQRLIENPERPDGAKARPDGARPEPGVAGPEPAPGPSIGDRSGEVR